MRSVRGGTPVCRGRARLWTGPEAGLVTRQGVRSRAGRIPLRGLCVHIPDPSHHSQEPCGQVGVFPLL